MSPAVIFRLRCPLRPCCGLDVGFFAITNVTAFADDSKLSRELRGASGAKPSMSSFVHVPPTPEPSLASARLWREYQERPRPDQGFQGFRPANRLATYPTGGCQVCLADRPLRYSEHSASAVNAPYAWAWASMLTALQWRSSIAVWEANRPLASRSRSQQYATGSSASSIRDHFGVTRAHSTFTGTDTRRWHHRG